jgi:hypothetical protein
VVYFKYSGETEENCEKHQNTCGGLAKTQTGKGKKGKDIPVTGHGGP